MATETQTNSPNVTIPWDPITSRFFKEEFVDTDNRLITVTFDNLPIALAAMDKRAEATKAAMKSADPAKKEAYGNRLESIKASRKLVNGCNSTLKAIATATAMSDLVQHPAGKIMPEMSPDDREELKRSMIEQGYLKEYPIVLLDGMILDGWHRYNVASELGIVPGFTDYKNVDAEGKALDPVAWVVSTNLARRHLTDDQRANIALTLKTLEADSVTAMTTAQAAAAMKVSASKVNRAQNIKNQSSTLDDAIRSGLVSLGEAERIVNDGDLLAVVNADDFDLTEVTEVAKRAQKTPAKSGRDRKIFIAADGPDSWAYATAVYDSEGELIGEAYVRDVPEVDVDELAESSQLDKVTKRENVRDIVTKLRDAECLAIVEHICSANPSLDIKTKDGDHISTVTTHHGRGIIVKAATDAWLARELPADESDDFADLDNEDWLAGVDLDDIEAQLNADTVEEEEEDTEEVADTEPATLDDFADYEEEDEDDFS